jgi:hypothetical protein
MFPVLAGSVGAEMPDILGIQLGMPAREAHVKLQAELPKNKIQVMSTNLPTIDKPVITSFASASPQTVMIGMEADQVTVEVTLPPNKQAVWRVFRTHSFPNKGIPKKTLLASLREKYGKEARAREAGGKTTTDESQIESLLWLMDEQGHPVTPPPLSSSGADPLWLCIPVAEASGALIVESPPPNYGNKDREWCLSSYTAVRATFQQGGLPELYATMNVVAVNLPFGARAGEATKKWKNDIAEGQHKQDIEKAKQLEKPKL